MWLKVWSKHNDILHIRVTLFYICTNLMHFPYVDLSPFQLYWLPFQYVTPAAVLPYNSCSERSIVLTLETKRPPLFSLSLWLLLSPLPPSLSLSLALSLWLLLSPLSPSLSLSLSLCAVSCSWATPPIILVAVLWESGIMLFKMVP